MTSASEYTLLAYVQAAQTCQGVPKTRQSDGLIIAVADLASDRKRLLTV